MEFIGEPTVCDRVRKLVCEHLGVPWEQATKDTTLTDDLMADSLDLVEIELAVEEEFGFRFSAANEGFEWDVTVGGLADIVEGMLANAG